MALISADVLYQGICTDCQTEEETRLAAAQKQAAESISR
jgi:ferric uptake regulation protein